MNYFGMPVNFWIIISAQLLLVIFYFYYARARMGFQFKPSDVFISLASGVIVGFIIDILVGTYGIAHYFGNSTSFMGPWGLRFHQLYINGLLSYGLLAYNCLIIYRINQKPYSPVITEENNHYIKLFYLVLSIVSFFLVFNLDKGTYTFAFNAGLLIVSLMELILLATHNYGPLTEFIVDIARHKSLKKISILYLHIVFVGILYEIINLIYPFWEYFWYNKNYNQGLSTLIMALFGYSALYYLLAFGTLLYKNRNREI